MIPIDPLEIKVITFTSKGMFPAGSPMRMKYMQRIEPRKIAYKLVQISETITKELLIDLATIENEHFEASRYSSVFIAEGKEVADKSRKPVRLHFEDNDENGSPFREKNWGQIGFLITKIALNLMKLDYQRSPDKSTQTTMLDKLNQHINAAFQPLSAEPVRRARQEILITRQLLESLCIEGLQGVITSNQPNIVNTRIIAEDFQNKRIFVSSIIRRILHEEDQYLRLQYKKITDFGGFTKLDLGKRPKYELIDLTVELKGAELKEKVLKKTPIERLSYSITTISLPTSDHSVNKEDDIDSTGIPNSRYINNSKQNSSSSSLHSEMAGSLSADFVEESSADDMMIIPMPGCEDYINTMFL
jgi:hypothetical protein